MSKSPTGAPVAVSVLTGFLGSGKTTLLNSLLKSADMSDTAVIINEFGEVGIDHLLVETADENVFGMASGCLCCTIRGDLINTLEGLLRARDNGRVTPFRRVIIETLRRTNGDKKLASQILGIATRTIYRKLESMAPQERSQPEPEPASGT